MPFLDLVTIGCELVVEGTWISKVTYETVANGSDTSDGERTGGMERVIGCDWEGDWDVVERGIEGVGKEVGIWSDEGIRIDCVAEGVGFGRAWELGIGLDWDEERGYIGAEANLENWWIIGSEDCVWPEETWFGLMVKDWEERNSISLNKTFLEM